MNKSCGEVGATAHSARERAQRPVVDIAQTKPLDELVDARLDRCARLMTQPTNQAEILASVEVLIDRRLLPGQPDQRTHRLGFADDIQTEDCRMAGVGPENRREDPDCRRCSRTIGPEQTDDGAPPD